MTAASPDRPDTLPFLVGVLVLLALLIPGLQWTEPVTEWVMVNVNDTPSQADAHLIRAGKETLLIDVGTEESASRVLLPYLKDLGISEVGRVLITHPHKDHYGGIPALLDAGIRMREVYFFMPYKSQCDGEIPWGCDYMHLRTTLDRLHSEGVVLRTANSSTSIQLSSAATLKVLHAYDGFNTPAGNTDVNDLSLIMRLEHGPTTVLFTGDLNNILGNYLSTRASEMKATVLKAPHHGAEGTAPNAFYEAVNPEQALVPAPALLWCSERSARTRKWLASRQIPAHVNGIHGHISVLLHRSGFRVSREAEASKDPCEALEGS
jgi:beta-lactamase superfamily II metal-dependent hydrolase